MMSLQARYSSAFARSVPARQDLCAALDFLAQKKLYADLWINQELRSLQHDIEPAPASAGFFPNPSS
jgi:hypothetical protein